MGETALDSADIDELLADMSREWAGSSYDLLHKNCCHFADALCTALGVGGTPPWLNRAAHAGAGLLDGAESLKNSLRQLNPVVAETGEAVEAALGRLDSKFRLSERLMSVESQAVDQMSAFNQKLVQHPAFAEACRVSFDKVVVDGDAGISLLGTELAVWMMYAKVRPERDHLGSSAMSLNPCFGAPLQLNSLLPVYLDPPPRDEILGMFGDVDTDGSGFLSRDEFRHFCTMLFSDDTKPHAISLARVSREVITNALMLPAACQVVSHYTAVVPVINRIPTVFLAPAITVRFSAMISICSINAQSIWTGASHSFQRADIASCNAGRSICCKKCAGVEAAFVHRNLRDYWYAPCFGYISVWNGAGRLQDMQAAVTIDQLRDLTTEPHHSTPPCATMPNQ
jgi:hypothetical protein